MLATDNHIGYMERDPIRGQDSINTFKEILELAIKHEVRVLYATHSCLEAEDASRLTSYCLLETCSTRTSHLVNAYIKLLLCLDSTASATSRWKYPY